MIPRCMKINSYSRNKTIPPLVPTGEFINRTMSYISVDENKFCVDRKGGEMKVFLPNFSNKTDSTASQSSSCLNLLTKPKETEIPPSSGAEAKTKIPESVLQFQRQIRKNQAAKRASTPLCKKKVHIVHNDAHVVVVNKPSGVLTVPGINSNPSMLTYLHEEYRNDLDEEMKREHMIVHRLDMDTSGIIIYAKTKLAMSNLQKSFRERDVSKFYEALVCGHICPEVEKGSIDLPLQRDHRFPPFMRVATPQSEREAKEVVQDLNHAGWKKIIKKKPKPSQTLFEIVKREYVSVGVDIDVGVDVDVNANNGIERQGKRQKQERFPVTRIRLIPITGRTHQLRVHCAAIGHPILGDTTYGVYGEASPNGGFDADTMDEMMPGRASINLQLSLDQYAKDACQVMCLHARELRVKHPETQEGLTFERPPDF